MDLNKVLRALIYVHKSYPALKLAWEGQLDIPTEELPLISPSHYLKELSMTTEERLEVLCKQQRKFEFWEPGTDLSVVPTVVIFQKFQPRKPYSLTISIRNISKRTQKIALLMDTSGDFSLDERSVQVSKFAPGMIFKTTINFNPQEDRDYFDKLVIVTKESRFAIPILGIGSRGILSAPDLIDFMKVPVKYLKTKVITMTNVGARPARFILSTVGPFCVSPERGVVNPKESFAMEVSFYSEKTLLADGLLHIQYENSERTTIRVRAEAINDAVYITPSRLIMEDTYIGLKSCATVEIINRTSVLATFRWKKFITKDVSKHARFEMEHYKPSMSTLHRYSYPIEHDALDPHVSCYDCSLPIIDPVLDEDWDTLFMPGDFLIEPVWGNVQPHSTRKCVVIFSPYKASRYETLAYCDITGNEDRVILALTGRGIQPTFTFGFDENFIPLPIASAQNNQSELVTDIATFDITVAGQPVGPIKIGLFGKTVPKTVRNFATICSEGINGKTYAGSAFHRVIKNFMIQGGDIIRGDGTGSASIYGGRFDDENFIIKHSGPGFLSMANSGPNTNGCQFFITAVATPWLDGHHVVFGKVVEGLNLVKQIENSPTGANDRPKDPVVIAKCSVTRLDQPYDLRLTGNDIWVWIYSVVPPLGFSLIVLQIFRRMVDKLDDSCYNIDKMLEERKKKSGGDGGGKKGKKSTTNLDALDSSSVPSGVKCGKDD